MRTPPGTDKNIDHSPGGSTDPALATTGNSPTSLEGLLAEYRHQDRVQLFANVLEKDHLAELDAILENARVVRVRCPDHGQPVLLRSFDPFLALPLRVYQQWPEGIETNT